MKIVTVISRDNKKALDALKDLSKAKADLRAFLASGGSVKDYNRKTTGVA
jgi:translation initiation factor 1 (eIF-1/SUI1)